jgi:type IV pilus assembly protein PilC
MVTKTFTYEAVDAAGALVKGTIESDSPDGAASLLAHQNLIPLEVTGQGTGLDQDVSLPGFRGKTTLKDRAVFARQFASMTSSGLTLLRTLGILEEQITKPPFKAAIGQVRNEVQGGGTLSKAMQQHPDHFPLLMVSMVKAGETGGFLDDALDRMAKMYEADADLRAKIKSALTYPVIVLVFSLLMGIGVIVFIVPVFEKMFKQIGGGLPLPTQIMVTLSHNAWWVLPVLAVVVVVASRSYRRALRTSKSFRLRTDRLKLRLPIFGALFAKLAISRWARNLGTLLAVGVPIISALEVVGSTSLVKHPLFPSMVTQMVKVGEESGQITDMLDKLADYYDDEVETATDSLTSAMEPLLVVLLGVIIGTMVVCLYLPMFSIYGRIQG